jgi:FG-GAP repeat
VNVLYGGGGGLSGAGSQVFTQVGGTVESGDRFGSALAAGDFDGDGFGDLAAGAPFEDVGTLDAAGAVSVLYGSAGGLTTSGGQLFTQVGGADEAGDLNDDGLAELAAAAPSEDVGTIPEAGAVSVLPGSGGGLTSAGGLLFTQNSPGVPGEAEPFDSFGGSEFAP